MNRRVWSIDRMILREEDESTLGPTRPSTRFVPQISHGPSSDWTRFPAVTDRGLIPWSMVLLLFLYCLFPMIVFCFKVMAVAERKYYDFLKSNTQAGVPRPKMHLVNHTGILFMYVCLWTFKYTHCKAAFLLVSFPMPSASLCRMTLMLWWLTQYKLEGTRKEAVST